MPNVTCFAPENVSAEGCVVIGYDEYEVLRLMDYVHMSQEECAVRIGVSRATVARLYEHARQAVAEALVLSKKLRIEGGDVHVCCGPKPECAGDAHCCHRRQYAMEEQTHE